MRVPVTEDQGNKDGLGARLLLCAFQGNDGSLGAWSLVYLWVWKDGRILSFVDRSRGENGKAHPYHGAYRLTGGEAIPGWLTSRGSSSTPMLLTCYP